MAEGGRTLDAAGAEAVPYLRAEPAWVARLTTVSALAGRMAACLSALLLALMTLLILTEIALRTQSLSTFMADALVGHGVAAITFLSLAYTMQSSGMIRIRLLHAIAGPRVQTAAEVFAVLTTLGMVIFLAVFVWGSLDRAWTRGTTSPHLLPIPLWIPDALFFVGLGLLVFHLLVRLIRLVTVGREEETETLM